MDGERFQKKKNKNHRKVDFRHGLQDTYLSLKHHVEGFMVLFFIGFNDLIFDIIRKV